MTNKNDATGDTIKTKVTSNAYRDNYDRIFKTKEQKEEEKRKRKIIEDIALDNLTLHT